MFEQTAMTTTETNQLAWERDSVNSLGRSWYNPLQNQNFAQVYGNYLITAWNSDWHHHVSIAHGKCGKECCSSFYVVFRKDVLKGMVVSGSIAHLTVYPVAFKSQLLCLTKHNSIHQFLNPLPHIEGKCTQAWVCRGAYLYW